MNAEKGGSDHKGDGVTKREKRNNGHPRGEPGDGGLSSDGQPLAQKQEEARHDVAACSIGAYLFGAFEMFAQETKEFGALLPVGYPARHGILMNDNENAH